MDSTMTLTQWEIDNSKKESAKPAKLSQEKVYNLDNQRRKFHAKNVETVNQLKNVGFQNKEFLDKFKMTIINNGHVIVKLNSGRKLKVKSMVSGGTLKFYNEVIQEGLAITETPVDINTAAVASEPKVESNVREFPSRTTLYTQEVPKVENVNSEPVNNMYSFANGTPMMATRSVVNSNNVDINNSTLSRTNRMDYNVGMMTKEEPKEVKPNPVHTTDIYSTTEYVQQKNVSNVSNGNNIVYFEAEKERLAAARARKIEMENLKNELLEKVAEKEAKVLKEMAMEAQTIEEDCMGMTIEITNLKERLQELEEAERHRKVA